MKLYRPAICRQQRATSVKCDFSTTWWSIK